MNRDQLVNAFAICQYMERYPHRAITEEQAKLMRLVLEAMDKAGCKEHVIVREWIANSIGRA